MAKVTISFGGDEITTSKHSTISEILRDSSISNLLGFDATRVEALVNGNSGIDSLVDGDTVVLTTKAASKA